MNLCRYDVNKPCENHGTSDNTCIDCILDKIRAEIKTKYDSIPWRNNDYDDGWVEALEWVLDDVIGE